MQNLFVPAPPQHIKKQRAKAQKLKKTKWWQTKLQAQVCYYCQKTFCKKMLSMDHVIPLVRGGHSTKNNIVVACKACNAQKKHKTIVDIQSHHS